jgi:hypothetical protein
VVDVMFPLDQLTSAVTAFQEKFPATPLRLYVEALGAVVRIRFTASRPSIQRSRAALHALVAEAERSA